MTGLLSVYQDYSPHLVFASSTLRHGTFFKAPDTQWLTSLARVQVKYKQDNSGSHGDKENVPHNSKDNFQVLLLQKDSKSLSTFATSLLERLELPSQLSTVLSSRALQHALSCLADKSALHRLGHWVEQCLIDMYLRSDPTPDMRRQFEALLTQAMELSQFMQETMPVFETFLTIYLKTWNGHDYSKQILGLLSTLHPRPYEELYGHFLKPLLRLFICSSPAWKAKLTLAYTSLLRQWAAIDWASHYSLSRTLSGKTMENNMFLFRTLKNEIDYFHVLHEFGQHIAMLNTMALQIDEDHVCVQHAALSYCELAAVLSTQYGIPFILIPPASLIYRCLFSETLMAVSRVCGVVGQYKIAFDSLKHSRGGDDAVTFHNYKSNRFKNGLHRVAEFNCFIIDISNCLWRNRTMAIQQDEMTHCFQVVKKNSLWVTHLTEFFKDVNYSFSLTHSATTASYALRYLQSRKEFVERMPSTITPALFTSAKLKVCYVIVLFCVFLFSLERVLIMVVYCSFGLFS